jgi:hypothetical protein
MTFEAELARLINAHSKERESETPDFVLARYLDHCLDAFTTAVSRRDRFHQNTHATGPADLPPTQQIDSWAGLEMPKPGGMLEVNPGGAPKVRHDCQVQPAKPVPEFEPNPVQVLGPPKSVLGVEGHYIGCLIDLDVDYHACTCEGGR